MMKKILVATILIVGLSASLFMLKTALASLTASSRASAQCNAKLVELGKSDYKPAGWYCIGKDCFKGVYKSGDKSLTMEINGRGTILLMENGRCEKLPSP